MKKFKKDKKLESEELKIVEESSILEEETEKFKITQTTTKLKYKPQPE